MRDELLNVLERKLESINKNIESLDLINSRLDNEKVNLEYVDEMLALFKDEDGEYDLHNFAKLDRDNFDKSIELVPETTAEKFETNSCNYDGLVYLINGINNGISLTLTEDQESAIQLLINGLNDKRIDYQASIEGINLAKTRLEESDGDVLSANQATYQNIVDELNRNAYVTETEEVMDAINYAEVNEEEKVDILNYLLKYNADIYKTGGENTIEKPAFSNIEDEINNEYNDLQEQINELGSIPFEEEVHEDVELPEEVELPTEEAEVSEPLPEDDEVPPISLPTEEEVEQEINNLVTPEETVPEEAPVELNTVVTPEVVEITPGPVDVPEVTVPETKEVEVAPEETVPEEPAAPVNTINRDELDKLLSDNHIRLDEIENNEELLTGDINTYKEVLNTLNTNEIISTVSKNPKLLKNILMNSNNEVLTKVLDIVKNDFSVDDDDYEETLKITLDTLPSIFVMEPNGSYNNFIKNVEMFKRLGFDLINLYDFSRELLVVDNELLEKNYNIVSKYEVKIDEKNAKYLLALKNVSEKMDYYVEAVYDDKITKKTFDGMNIIRMYPSKLDSVRDLTIKRLRYSSENSKKMFGSRENSIAGEVANLKVDVLEIPEYYFSTFFNNEFEDITSSEVTSYRDMVNNSTEYEFSEDEVLNGLSTYRDGLRYNIEGINVSYNKVLRNYNILKENNVDPMKALEYAVCYNLVITKDEYTKLNNLLKTIGGR